jgi:hypothetical protein
VVTIAQAKAIARLSPTCRHEPLGLETTRSLLVAFPDTPKHRCLRDCLAMKMHAPTAEVQLRNPPPQNSKRAGPTRVFFGRKLISWTQHRIQDQASLLRSACSLLSQLETHPKSGISRRRRQFGSEDVESLDRTLTAFISRHGFARAIFDFSLVKANAAPQTFLTWHGRSPQVLLGQERVIVAPQQWSYELACAYAAQQRDFGNLEPRVVRSLGDACHLLGVERPDFRPVP